MLQTTPRSAARTRASESPRERTHGESSRLDFMWLELTRKCNLRCVHCYADSGPELPLHEGMGSEDWQRVIADATALGCRKVQFIGGEATLHPEIDSLIDHARSLDYRYIEVYTNATSLTEKRVSRFCDLGVQLACTFYSNQSRIHDQITRCAGSFDKTVQGIKRVVGAGMPLRCGIIEMDENRDHAEATKRFLQDLGVEEIGVDRVRHIGRGGNGRVTKLGWEDTCGNCARERICVTATGDVFPCIMSRSSKVGNVLETGLAEIMPSEEFVSFRGIMGRRFPHKWRSKGLHAEHGDEGCRPERGDQDCRPERGDQDCRPERGDQDCRPEIPERREEEDCRPEIREDCRPEPREDCRPERGDEDCRPEIREDCRPERGDEDCRPERGDEDCRPEIREDCRPEPREDCRPEPREDCRPEVREDCRPDAN